MRLTHAAAGGPLEHAHSLLKRLIFTFVFVCEREERESVCARTRVHVSVVSAQAKGGRYIPWSWYHRAL